MKTADAPPAGATDETPPLVFQWGWRQRAHWRLAVLIALSLLVHAVAFYVFQVAYTPTGSQSAPSVQVTMLPTVRGDAPPETRAQARALAQSLAVDDPSLTVEPTLPESGLPRGDLVQYVPSYKAAPPPFKPLDPPATGNAAPPRPRPPGPVPTVSGNATTLPATPAPPTRIVLTGDIAPLAPGEMPPVTFALPSGATTLSSTTFLVGVRAEGGAPFLFRESSSGDVSADEFAQDYLAHLSFGPPAAGTAPTVWGWAEFHWGRDVYRAHRLP